MRVTDGIPNISARGTPFDADNSAREYQLLERALGELEVRKFIYIHYKSINKDQVLSLISIETQAGYFRIYWPRLIPRLPPGQSYSDKHLADFFRSSYYKDLAVTLHFNSWVEDGSYNDECD